MWKNRSPFPHILKFLFNFMHQTLTHVAMTTCQALILKHMNSFKALHYNLRQDDYQPISRGRNRNRNLKELAGSHGRYVAAGSGVCALHRPSAWGWGTHIRFPHYSSSRKVLFSFTMGFWTPGSQVINPQNLTKNSTPGTAKIQASIPGTAGQEGPRLLTKTEEAPAWPHPPPSQDSFVLDLTLSHSPSQLPDASPPTNSPRVLAQLPNISSKSFVTYWPHIIFQPYQNLAMAFVKKKKNNPKNISRKHPPTLW